MEIQKFDLPPGTDVKVVSADEMKYGASYGWRLLAVVPEVQPVQLTENESGSEGRFMNRLVHRETTKIWYVLARDPHEVIDALRSENAGWRTSGAERVKEKEEAEANLKAAEKKLALAQGELESVKKNHTTMHQSYIDATTAKRKMENDIAKLRTAIGDIRMKEILGS